MLNFYFNLINILSYFIIIPILLGVFYYNKLDTNFRILFIYLIITLISSILGNYLAFHAKNNIAYMYIFGVFEFYIFTYLYSRFLNNVINKKIFLFIALIFSILFIFSPIYLFKITEFSAITKLPVLIIFILYSIIYIYTLLVKDSKFTDDPIFWLSIGVLFYSSCTFLLYATLKYHISLAPLTRIRIWTFHAVFLLIYHLLAALALYKNSKRENVSSSR